MTSKRLAVIVGATAVGVLVSTAGAAAVAGGPPSTTAAVNTPQLAIKTGTVQQVRQLARCGGTMYAVGTFSTITSKKTTFTRNGAFSFSASAPYTVSSWDPDVNGTVNSIAFNGTDCADAYLGGKFTSVDGTAVKDIAEVSTSTGVVTGFAHSAAGEVETLLGWNGHILAGGMFTSINGSGADPYFTSLNSTTGRNDGYLKLGISGNYEFTDDAGNHTASNPTRIYNQQLSPNGSKLLVEGDFTSIGGQPRQQVAMLDLGAAAATTDAWYPTEFNASCDVTEPFYARAASWSPDGQTVYVAATGYKPANGAGFSTSSPRAGLCDAAIAFPATSGTVTHKWLSYTGCDSLYATAADSSTAYFGGHERWINNPLQCDNNNSGAATAAPGMVGLSPANGAVTYNPGRSRGLGADDMLVTSAGLWVASDTQDNNDLCGGSYAHAGICLLPY